MRLVVSLRAIGYYTLISALRDQRGEDNMSR